VLAGTALLLAVGIAMLASAQTFGWLLAGRGVSAVAHGAFWAIVTPTAAGLFGSAERGRSVARLLLGTSLAGIIGLPLFTVLAQHVGWRAPYWLLCVSVAVAAVAIVLIMPSFRAEQGTAARGLIPSWPIFARILVVCGLTVASVALTWTFLTPFATEVAGMSHSAVPTLLLLGGVSGFVAMFLVGRYLDRFPVRSVAIGLAILGSVWAVMGLFGSVAWVLVVCVAAQGFGWSVLVAAMVNWAIRHAPGSTDTANGTYATVFGAGNASGSLLGAALLAAVGAAWLPVASLAFVLGSAVLVWTMRGVGVARRGSRVAR
jgi:predicted MFS family arabinose efflux permease